LCKIITQRLSLCLVLTALMVLAGSLDHAAHATELMDLKTEELARPAAPASTSRTKPPAGVAHTHQLSGIVLGGGRAMAIIDAGFYKEGDLLDSSGARVRAIEPDRVVLALQDGTEAVLRIDMGGR